ncbi:MAG: hypothetical protein GKR93_15090 [Gammaproteobacteria bacterium]|nr:hypothetical protein [Gammaproteobacteria bacterium]
MLDQKFISGIVEALLTAIDNQDWDSLAKLFSDDAVYEVTGFPLYKGRKAIMTYYEKIRPIQSGVHTIESIYTNDNAAVCCGNFTGLKNNGERIDLRFADELEFENFKIRNRRVYFCQSD